MEVAHHTAMSMQRLSRLALAMPKGAHGYRSGSIRSSSDGRRSTEAGDRQPVTKSRNSVPIEQYHLVTSRAER
jgi:hypothetical protein